MAILPIRIFPDPVLRVRCQEVEAFDESLERLAANMVQTMHAAPGIGLAASQVGVEKRIALVDVSVGEDPDSLLVMVNPELADTSGLDIDEEGCLSIPGITEKVKRAESIRLVAMNLDGEPFELEAEGLVARAIQHEIDHLDGVLFVDHLSGLRREKVKRQLRRLIREQEAEAS